MAVFPKQLVFAEEQSFTCEEVLQNHSWHSLNKLNFQEPFTRDIMSLQETGMLRKFFYDTLNPPVYVPLPRYKIEAPIGMN